jgi:hypothetical protein
LLARDARIVRPPTAPWAALDGVELSDLRAIACDLMKQIEEDLGTRLA